MLPVEAGEYREMNYKILNMFDRDDLDQICADANIDIDIDTEEDMIVGTNNFDFVAGVIAALTHLGDM